MSLTKSNTPLHCRCCGKAIRKWTTEVRVEEQESPFHKDSSYCRYIYTELFNKADCQRFTNKVVTSVKYHNDKVYAFNEWDGETYHDDLFCGVNCAAHFGRGIARSTTYATDAWRKANKETGQ